MVLPQEVQRKVSSIENLATLPNIATEILEMIRKSSSNMREIARVIEKDVSVTTKILKVSNSPLWGFAGRIDNVNRALVILGLKQVTDAIMQKSAPGCCSAGIFRKPFPRLCCFTTTRRKHRSTATSLR
ncbi:hypothetical protein B1H10_05040 [candidate division KSB1 bacterium 4484_188]|nr:MAG: hypothetical protein B1H10_05040 [candidate division KSB1 bacterium 4484_188]